MKFSICLIAFSLLFGASIYAQQFSSQQVINGVSAHATSADGARCVYATDLDGDGDADVLASADIDDTIVWFENLGNGNFDAQQNLSNPFWAYDNDFHATDYFTENAMHSV